VLNAAPIALNGRMPYDPAANAAVGLEAGVETPKNEPAHAKTRLAALGDTIPVPVLRKVVSPGDLLIGGGACALVALAMRRHRRAGGTPDDRIDDLAPARPGVVHAGHAALHGGSAA
jgi:hypothetical protein